MFGLLDHMFGKSALAMGVNGFSDFFFLNHKDVHDILWSLNDLEHICQDMLSDNPERLFYSRQLL